MQYKKLLTKSVTILGLSCLSAVAFAGDLVIDNRTNEPSTCKAYSKCSTDRLGSHGVTPANKAETYQEAKLRIMCTISHLDYCEAEVYMNDNCLGTRVATAILDVKKGLISITNMPDSRYNITGTPGTFAVKIKYKS